MNQMTINSTKFSEKLDPIDRVVLTRLWYLPGEYKELLDKLEFFTCPLEEFIKRTEPFEDIRWQYEFTCSGLERGLNKDHLAAKKDHFYRVDYHNCSSEWIKLMGHTRPDLTVCFQLRVHIASNFFQCLVRLNEPDWKLKEYTVWRAFPVSSGVE